MISNIELKEFIQSGQWRCTVEEVQDAARRLLARVERLESALSIVRDVAVAHPHVSTADRLRLLVDYALIDITGLVWLFTCNGCGYQDDGNSEGPCPKCGGKSWTAPRRATAGVGA